MRTIWKGNIQFSLVNIPIRLYSAVDSSHSISFDWLSEDEHHQVGYTKTDKKTGEPIEQGNIVKGYEYEPDQYVIIEDEDIEKVEADRSKVIDIVGFIDEEQTHPTLYDKPYFIGPESESTVGTYRLFTKTLKETGKMAVGKVVLRKKESPALLTFYKGGLLMYKLRYPDQVRDMKEVPNVDEAEEVNDEQLEMAKELVGKMTKDFSEIDLENYYYEDMKKMIEKKIEGEEVITVEEEEQKKPKDIMTALKESINSNGNGKSNGQEYADLTKDELYEKAEEADIDGRSKMNKDELIKALRKH